MSGGDVIFGIALAGVVVTTVSIAGGVVMAMVRGKQQQHLTEMAQRERLAWIERGLDPSQLPPFPMPNERDEAGERRAAIRRQQDLTVGGLVLVCLGIGLALFLWRVAGDEVFMVGILPFSIGVALLLGSRVVKSAEPAKH